MSPAQKARENKKLKGGPSPNRLCGSGEPLVEGVVYGQRAEAVTGGPKRRRVPQRILPASVLSKASLWMVSERRSQSLEAENL